MTIQGHLKHAVHDVIEQVALALDQAKHLLFIRIRRHQVQDLDLLLLSQAMDAGEWTRAMDAGKWTQAMDAGDGRGR